MAAVRNRYDLLLKFHVKVKQGNIRLFNGALEKLNQIKTIWLPWLGHVNATKYYYLFGYITRLPCIILCQDRLSWTNKWHV